VTGRRPYVLQWVADDGEVKLSTVVSPGQAEVSPAYELAPVVTAVSLPEAERLNSVSHRRPGPGVGVFAVGCGVTLAGVATGTAAWAMATGVPPTTNSEVATLTGVNVAGWSVAGAGVVTAVVGLALMARGRQAGHQLTLVPGPGSVHVVGRW